jgi:Tetratricopeptide repeat
MPPVSDGRVLITSRNALWPPRQLVEVPVLDVDVAAGFLVERTRDSNRQAAVRLAEELGGLPLTLEQAGAYIQATGDSLAAYLAGFRRRRADAALLPIRERVLGPEDPAVLITRNNLGSWSGEAGDADGARDQFAALLLIRERVLGPEDLATLATRNNLANWTAEAGDVAGARDQFAALLPLVEQVLGPEHPDTLITRANLARWTGEAGEPSSGNRQAARSK